MVPLGHVPPAERHRRPGQAVVVSEADDLGGPKAPVGRPHARAAVQGLKLRPIGPVVEPVLVGLDGLRRLVPEHDESSHHGRDVDRLPVPVQDQCRELQHVPGHHRLRQGCSEGVRRGLNPSPRAPRTRVLPLHHGHHRKGGRIHRLAPERKSEGFEPSSPFRGNRLSRAARQTVSDYLPFEWTAGESNPLISGVQSRCRPVGPAAR